VAAVQVDEPLIRERPQPEEEGQGGAADVFIKPSRRLDIDVLENVGRIEPSLQTWIEPHLYHAPEPGAVAGIEAREDLLSVFVAACFLEEPRLPEGVFHHDRGSV
jgi:hypothetical protein